MKKLFAVALTAVLTLLASAALAASVARVGDQEYSSFGDAVNAAIAGPAKTITIIGEVNGYSFPGKNMTGVTIEGSATGKVTGFFNVTGSGTNFKNATIRNLKFEGGAIIFSTAAASYEGLTITGCQFIGSGRDSAAIQVQKTAAIPVDGLTITNNTISGYEGSGILLNGAGGSGAAVTIEGNTITDVTGNGIQALNIEELIIEDNTIKGSSAPFNLYGTQKTKLSGNKVTMTDSQWVLIYVSGLVDVAANNQILDKNGKAVTLSDSNCHSEAWNEKALVAVNAATDAGGKYTDGQFVGSIDAVNRVLAAGVQISGSGNNYQVAPANPPVPPQTGDSAQLMLWMLMLMLAAAALVTMRRQALQK